MTKHDVAARICWKNPKSFYRQWDFEKLPGHPLRPFLSAAKLDAMMSPG